MGSLVSLMSFQYRRIVVGKEIHDEENGIFDAWIYINRYTINAGICRTGSYA